MELRDTIRNNQNRSIEISESVVKKSLEWYEEIDPKYKMTSETVNIRDETEINGWTITTEFFAKGENELGFKKENRQIITTISEIREQLSS